MDLAKAFNTVDPGILLQKLEKYGIRGLPLKLISSYLSERYQYTYTNNTKSSLKQVHKGVPQGSSLGPLLFLIFINDLPLATNMTVRMFADDACLSFNHPDPQTLQDTVNKELKLVNNWLVDNKLYLNEKKTTYIIFTNKHISHKFKISINNNELKQSISTKYLGIIIDEKLNWKKHIKNLRSKLASNNYALLRLRNFVDEDTLVTIYYSLIYSHLQYCISTWGKASKTNIKPIESMQKRALRNMFNLSPCSHTNPVFSSKKILKLKDIYKFQLGKLTYKITKNQMVGGNPFVNLNKQHKYSTRSSLNNNFIQPGRRTEVGIRSFKYQAPLIWREIPLFIKESNSFNIFKLRFKKHLISKYSI